MITNWMVKMNSIGNGWLESNGCESIMTTWGKAMRNPPKGIVVIIVKILVVK